MTVELGVREENKVKVAFLGGDQRQVMAFRQLEALGFRVSAQALPGTDISGDSSEQADYFILPIPGLDEQGFVRPNTSGEVLRLTEQWVAALEKPVVILIGSAPDYFRQWCQQYDIKLIEYLKDEDFQRANAVPTAEGAIYLAMTESSRTINGSQSVVLGMGKCGLALAARLKALGSTVSVTARKEADFALGRSYGFRMITYAQLPEAATEAHYIFNTVPARVLDKAVLTRISQGSLIIDLASVPGGTDFPLAEKLGLKCLPAGNLPGRFFPETAGRLLAEHLLKLIQMGSSLSVKSETGGC